MPRFAFRMIRLLVGMCGVKTETLAVVREFSFFTGTSKVFEIITQYFYTKCLFLPNVSEFLKLQKYGQSLYYYRLSCLRKILFLHRTKQTSNLIILKPNLGTLFL